MKKTKKGTGTGVPNPHVLAARVAETEKQVKIARDKAHRAKVEFKQARKAFKQAKKAAKQVRKLAKVAAKELKPAARKTTKKAAKPPVRRLKRPVAKAAPRPSPSSAKAEIRTSQPATPVL